MLLSFFSKYCQVFKVTTSLVKASLVTTLLALIFVAQVNAASLTVPDVYVVKEMDGQKVSKGFFAKETEVALKKGEHILVLFYKDLFEDFEFGLGSSITVTSAPFVIKFILDEQQSLFLTSPKIKNQKSAKLYAKSPKVMLKDAKGEQLAIKYVDFAEYKAVKELNEMMVLAQKSSANHSKALALQASTKAIVAPVPLMTENKSVVKKTETKTTLMPQSLPMLKFWWQKASPQEKAQFKQYIVE